MFRIRTVLAAVGVVALGLVTTACSKSTDASATTAAAVNASSQPSVAEPVEAEAQPSQPVAGGRTMVAVKVDNAPTARPLVGIDRASLLTEVEVEGGITRFAAFFEPGSFPDLVGPVRSVRPVDADLVGAFASAVVSTGGRPWVLGAVEAAGVRSIDELEASGFQFAIDRDPPHNIFVTLDQLLDEEDLEARPWLADGDWPGGDSAAAVTIPFSEPAVWTFADGLYVREGLEVSSDAEGNGSAPLAVDTVVVLSAARRSAGYTDSLGAEVPTYDMVGSGPVVVFSGGQVVKGTWSRSAQADPYELLDETGAELGVPGARVYLAVLDRELTPDF